MKKTKCYVHNCTGCGRLHIWGIKVAKEYGMRYRCMECQTVNDIEKSCLM